MKSKSLMRTASQRTLQANKLQSRQLRLESLEQRMLLAGDTYLINFQFDEAEIPTGYERDTGALFGDRGNGLTYGWTSDHSDQSRERNLDPDQRLDTLIHIEAGQEWEFQLPNGSYEVTVAVGDPANNDGVNTINVEGLSFFSAVPDTDDAMIATQNVVVSDGRLTLDAGAAADLATRIDYIHVVGISSGGNAAPGLPTITEPELDGQVVNPSDVHMEAIGFTDADGDQHKSSDWEIWTVGPGAEPVWQTLGIQGVERLHTHLGDGIFFNASAGETNLEGNTDYELRVRFRDDAGSVSDYATRLFHTAAVSTTFPLQIEGISSTPAPTWQEPSGTDVDLPSAPSLLSPSDAIIAIDTDGGSDYPAGESPQNAIDGTLEKYLNFGEENSGFIVTPSAGASILGAFQIITADDAEDRDPTSWELYGTNDAVTSGDNSTGNNEAWTLIDAGILALPAARDAAGPTVSVNNTTAYASYRMLFTGVKDAGAANSMQFAEIQFFGELAGAAPLLSPASTIIAIDTSQPQFPQSSYPGNESPQNAIDGTLDKYLNFGETNSGFIVTPTGNPSVVESFQITTANDAEERDPDGWELYGTNDPITSADNSNGSDENWTLIDAGSLNLPAARDALGPLVAVDNNTEYTSYRMIFTGVKDADDANSMQIAEIQFFGDSGIAPSASTLSIEGAAGESMLLIEGSDLPGNTTTHFTPLSTHEAVRIVVVAGSSGLSLSRTDLAFTDELGNGHTAYLPAISLPPGQRLDLWVASSGATYFGAEGQTEPDFSFLARPSDSAIPFIALQPGYVVDEVSSNYRLPVNIAFVPDPGPNPDDPLYYVTELYGSIQVVTRDGVKHEFATGLLDYNPEGPISGSGEQGLTGIAVQRDATDPEIYHLYVGMLADNGSPAGNERHYPKVERIDSVAGGLSLASRTVLLNMQPETQGQSHQISNISIGPDGKLYVHNGDGFDASTALDLDQYRGKILRLNLDGTAPSDNPFYDAGNGINARDYVYAYGLRNPFGGAWRASDGKHYSVENGPSVDRLAQINEGVSYGWNGSNASMQINALYNWDPSHAPVNITFVQQETFNGSLFPAEKMDRAFVSESGPTYAQGGQVNGKRIVEFELDANGNVLGGPTTLVEYVGLGRSSVVGLAAGPDGLYFSELYEDSGDFGPFGVGARIYRVRYVGGQTADFDIDGDVDGDDLARWEQGYGTSAGATVANGDADEDQDVDGFDFLEWQRHFTGPGGSPALAAATVDDSSVTPPSVAAQLAQSDLRELALAAYASEANSSAELFQESRISRELVSHESSYRPRQRLGQIARRITDQLSSAREDDNESQTRSHARNLDELFAAWHDELSAFFHRG